MGDWKPLGLERAGIGRREGEGGEGRRREGGQIGERRKEEAGGEERRREIKQPQPEGWVKMSVLNKASQPGIQDSSWVGPIICWHLASRD